MYIQFDYGMCTLLEFRSGRLFMFVVEKLTYLENMRSKNGKVKEIEIHRKKRKRELGVERKRKIE